MAQKKHQVMLSSEYTPITPLDFSAQVVMLGPESQNFRRLVPDTQQNATAHLPQIAYMENMLPSLAGVSSCGYTITSGIAALPSGYALSGPLAWLDGDSLQSRLGLAYVRNGVNPYVFVYDAALNSWSQATALTPADLYQTHITTARVQGRDYAFLPNVGCYQRSAGSGTWVRQYLDGLEESTLLGIIASNGYLLAYSADAIAWSTTLNLHYDDWVADAVYATGEFIHHDGFDYEATTGGTAGSLEPTGFLTATTPGDTFADNTVTWTTRLPSLDFVPDEVTGAGGGDVEELRGDIVCAKAVTGGFITYTTNNAVACLYSGNASYPFIFKNVASCAGILSPYMVTDSDNQNGHYAYTPNGVQFVASTGAKRVFPEWSFGVDYINSSTNMLRYDTVGSDVELQELDTDALNQLHMCAGRYLVASFPGVMYVYDTQLKRAARFVLSGHAFAITNSWAAENTALPLATGSKQFDTLGYVSTTGVVYAVLNTAETGIATVDAPAGVLVLGNFKHVLEQDITMLNVELVGQTNDAAITCTKAILMTSYNGRDFTEFTDLVQESTGSYVALQCCQEGVMHAIYLEGQLPLTGAVLTYTTGGHSIG